MHISVSFAYMEWCMQASAIVKLPCGWMGMQTSQRCDTVPPHSFHFLCQSHIETPILSLYVCTMHPSVHNHCEGSGNTSRHTDTSQPHWLPVICTPVLLQSFTFIFPNTAAEDQRRAGAWPGSREESRGEECKDGGRKRSAGGGSKGSFVISSSCILVLL